MVGQETVESKGRKRKLTPEEEIEMVSDGEKPGSTPEAVAVKWGVSKGTYYNVRARVRADLPATKSP